ncbi:MAG: peptide deformylase [Thermodesulfobacteriota bacterium]
MSLLKILLYPHPLLQEVSAEVDPSEAGIKDLVEDLVQTMRDHGGVGIAAPQTGVLKRIIIVDVGPEKNGHGLLRLLNPRIVFSSGKRKGREGCLSVPEYRANITRARKVRVEALTPQGEPFSLEAKGFEAVALQHEIDHLDGILFIDRVTDMRRDLFRREPGV